MNYFTIAPRPLAPADPTLMRAGWANLQLRLPGRPLCYSTAAHHALAS